MEIFIFNNIWSLIGFILFFTSFIIFWFLIIFLIMYKNIIKNIQEAIQTFQLIKNSSIKFIFIRAEKISKLKPEYQSKIDGWKAKVKILFEIEINKKVNNLIEYLNDTKSLRPSLKNLRIYKEINKEIKVVNSSVNTLYFTIFEFLREEYLLRNYVIYQKTIFDDLKDRCNALFTSHRDINPKKLDNVLGKIQVEFFEFYNFLTNGEYDEAINKWLLINKKLLFLIDMLDSIPRQFATLKKVIPDQIEKLKTLYLTEVNKEKIRSVYNKVGELSIIIQKEIVKNIQLLRNLQFITAKKEINKILTYIKNVQNSIEHGDKLRMFFDNYLPELESYLNLLDSVQINTEKQFAILLPFSEKITDERKELEKTKKEWKITQDAGFRVINNFKKNGSILTNQELVTLKNEISEVIKKMVNVANRLEKSNNSLSKRMTSTDKLLNNSIYLQSLISQYEIKIQTNKTRIPELEWYITDINNLVSEAKQISVEKLDELNNDSDKAKELERNLSSLSEGIESLIIKVNDAIFLDYISQELIIFLERYTSRYPQLENAIINLEKLYYSRDLNQLIGYWLSVMADLNQQSR